MGGLRQAQVDRGRQRVAATLRGPALWLTVCGVALVIAIFVGTIVMVDGFRERTLANNERELENTVSLLSRHFDQQFIDSDIIAGNVIGKLNLSGIASPEEFRAKMSTPDVHQILKAKSVSFLGHAVLFDADGKAITWSGDLPVPAKLNIAERGYFKNFKFSATPEDVHAETMQSMLIERGFSTIIAHRLTNADGTFLGVMTRRIDPQQYETFFASIAPGAGSSIAMIQTDGTLLARYPHVDGLVGHRRTDVPLANLAIREPGQHTMRMISPIDGTARLGSAARLSHFPAIIIATNTVEAALADWRTQTRFLLSAAMLAALTVALVLAMLIRQIVSQNRESQRRLEAERQRLDTALNNMNQGLVLFDASARIVLFNQRYLDMCGLSAEIVKPGCSFETLLQHRRTTGSFDGDVAEFCTAVLTNVALGKMTEIMTSSTDGRSFSTISRPLAHGGWVATIEDITERRDLAEERDRNNAFLREIVDHIPSQITVKDAQTRRYLLVNRVAELQFGLAREKIVGRTAFDVFSRVNAALVTADDDALVRTNKDIFKDEHSWHSHVTGEHYITSQRIGIRDEAGEPRYIVNVVEDVTERRRANERIAHLAHYDALTDLPNRVLFREQIERELEKARRGLPFALLYIDIDEFKGINDSLGHHVGDELLKTVAQRIKTCLGDGDLIARLGGDEFAVIRTAISGVDAVEDFVGRVHRAIRQPCDCLGHHLSTDASIGVALAPLDGTELDQLIRNADIAMYGAKAKGRRTHRFFEPEMGAQARARLAMEQDLRQALADNAFEIHYQPLLDLASGAVTGCEALLRWRHPERGMVSPAEFIPVAESAGLIEEIGEWVLRTACMEAATWPDHIRIAVNVSPIQFKNLNLALNVISALAASKLTPERLELEITEAVLIGDDEIALAILHQLRAIGVRIALDDFGTGYSSLSYLKRFPFDKIKIDRSFVSDIAVDGSAAIVRAVVDIAASRNMTTTAEGVETQQQRDLLRTLGCTEMQGYLFSAAKPAAELRGLLFAEATPMRASA